jgi:hypothetical protein
VFGSDEGEARAGEVHERMATNTAESYDGSRAPRSHIVVGTRLDSIADSPFARCCFVALAYRLPVQTATSALERATARSVRIRHPTHEPCCGQSGCERYSRIPVTATTRVIRRSTFLDPKPGRDVNGISPLVHSNPDKPPSPSELVAADAPLATMVEPGAPARWQKWLRRLLSRRFSVFFGSCVDCSPNQTNYSRTFAVGTVCVWRLNCVKTGSPSFRLRGMPSVTAWVIAVASRSGGYRS